MNAEALTKLLALEKPSELFSLALDDLEALQKTPGYVVNMDVWINESGANCHVCLAGALLKKTVGMDDSNWHRIYNHHDFNQSQEEQLVSVADSLNEFRQGYIYEAVSAFTDATGKECTVPEGLEIFDIPDYERDREGFMSGARDVITALKENNL